MIPPKFQQDTRSLSNYTNRIPAIHIYLTDTKCHTAFLLHVMTFDGNRYEKSDAVTHSNSRETSKQNVFWNYPLIAARSIHFVCTLFFDFFYLYNNNLMACDSTVIFYLKFKYVDKGVRIFCGVRVVSFYRTYLILTSFLIIYARILNHKKYFSLVQNLEALKCTYCHSFPISNHVFYYVLAKLCLFFVYFEIQNCYFVILVLA